MSDLLAVLVEEGMLLESARGPIPNCAELVAGEPIRGSWWAHPAAHQIFDVINALDDSSDVARLRLINGKITLVHRRVWPALSRLRSSFPPEALARVDEVHTASGRHRAVSVPFAEWLPDAERRAGEALSADEAAARLPGCLRPSPGPGTAPRARSRPRPRSPRR
jgi:hypothetical protein